MVEKIELQEATQAKNTGACVLIFLWCWCGLIQMLVAHCIFKSQWMNKYAFSCVTNSYNGNNIKSIEFSELFLQSSNINSKEYYSNLCKTDLCSWLVPCSNYDNKKTGSRKQSAIQIVLEGKRKREQRRTTSGNLTQQQKHYEGLYRQSPEYLFFSFL